MPASDDAFPPGFFARSDAGADARFYAPPRLVTHIDDRAIAAVGELYEELEVSGDVLDLMGSWVSHFRTPPRHLTVLGMNEVELAANPQAAATTVHDLNVDSRLPFADATFDDVVCCVSVDYLVDPVEVFGDVARVLRPGGRFVCTFSNRCFPTKAIRGWLMASDEQRVEIVAKYFRLAQGWEEPVVETRLHAGGAGFASSGRGAGFGFGDPLFAVWSRSVHSSS
jgi:SAM-dependent methyltransferase